MATATAAKKMIREKLLTFFLEETNSALKQILHPLRFT
jgi:hypothetical protein